MKHSDLNTSIREHFSRGDIPTQEQFAELIDAATDNRATFSLMAHLFGITTDCVITDELDSLSGNLHDDSTIQSYHLTEGESVLVYLQDDSTVNGVYKVFAAEDPPTLELHKQNLNVGTGMLLKANRSKEGSASFYVYAQVGEDSSAYAWQLLTNFDIPEYMAPYLRNARLPEKIDLTKNGIDSKVTAKLFSGQFEGDGSDIHSLNADELTSGKVPSARFSFSSVDDIRNGVTDKVFNSELGTWFNHKLESLACPVLKNTPVRCVETSVSIDVLQPPTHIDNVLLEHNDYVLLSAQHTPSQNGVWQLDMHTSPARLNAVTVGELSTLSTGDAVAIEQGNTHRGSVFVVSAEYINDDMTDYYWQPVSSLSTVGGGLNSDNNLISVDFASALDVQSRETEKVVDADVLGLTLQQTSTILSDDYTAKIDTEKARIDSILAASDADKDSFAEIVALINSVDTESDEAFAGYVQSNDLRSTQIEQGLAIESQHRSEQDTTFTESLATESQARIDQGLAITEALQTETDTRTAESAARYTKGESDSRYVLKTGDTLSGPYNVTAASLVGDLNVQGAIVASKDVTAFSDARLKSDVSKIERALEKLTQLDGVTFSRTDLEDGRRYSGVIAQQVEAIFPEVVHQEGLYLSVAYGNMVGLLIESIKELNSKVTHLENKLNNVDNVSTM
ncbi:hypothetical protein BGP78_01640 [Pseudoalteromonas sp. MSK9-3]|uniref:tail fiber domain-containing protein n=1 Tax=Pseudoalteromonas sp. MSK9-3 TaxID=1897633 RepID=UPI000E6C6AB4|nr:tail fiber domain-containing protein [Pseudoalteromonas sp. MSK9-3]RJE76976.1 hypothetical protein BGP78_01640 [Pseudoalteromonas sp. MSK9-3]